MAVAARTLFVPKGIGITADGYRRSLRLGLTFNKQDALLPHELELKTVGGTSRPSNAAFQIDLDPEMRWVFGVEVAPKFGSPLAPLCDRGSTGPRDEDQRPPPTVLRGSGIGVELLMCESGIHAGGRPLPAANLVRTCRGATSASLVRCAILEHPCRGPLPDVKS